MTDTWTLTYGARPWLLNAERSGGRGGIGGHFGRAELVREWRETFALLAREQRMPPLEWIRVEVQQTCATRRLPDTGSCFPAVKAAIDGLVDVNVIPDDGPRYVQALTFLAPVALGYDALTLHIVGHRAVPRTPRRPPIGGRRAIGVAGKTAGGTVP